ncbi:MAG: hypothetical protein IMZ46_11380 [Acidobacteria bacterium]|nr:hypothetical protein [Acidobacteriota bacterium]
MWPPKPKELEAARAHTLSLTHGQRYVLLELRVLFGAATDDDAKGRINLLERAFRGTVTRAVNRELNRIRRNGMTGQALLKTLGDLFYQHNMRDWLDRRERGGRIGRETATAGASSPDRSTCLACHQRLSF